MYQHVAEAGNLPPRKRGQLGAQFRGNPLCCLTDDLQVAHHRILIDHVGKELFPTCPDAVSNPSTSFQNVMQIKKLALHKGTASRNTSSRMNQWSPRSDPISTVTPSKSSRSCFNPTTSSRLRSGSHSTRRSRSL